MVVEVCGDCANKETCKYKESVFQLLLNIIPRQIGQKSPTWKNTVAFIQDACMYYR